MKKFVIVALTLALVASLFLTSCSSVLDSTTIAGSWFCQLGEDDGLLENEYTFDIKTIRYLGFKVLTAAERPAAGPSMAAAQH